MKTQQAIDYFGGRKALADAIGCDRSAIARWGDNVPGLRPYQIQVLSGGKLKASVAVRPSNKEAA